MVRLNDCGDGLLSCEAIVKRGIKAAIEFSPQACVHKVPHHHSQAMWPPVLRFCRQWHFLPLRPDGTRDLEPVHLTPAQRRLQGTFRADDLHVAIFCIRWRNPAYEPLAAGPALME